MTYEKQNWKTEDIITSAKLNHIEDGIAGGILVIGGFSYDYNSGSVFGTSDKTWQEIDNALATGARCVVTFTDMGGHRQLAVEATGHDDGKYGFLIGPLNDGNIAETTSADGYPTAKTN